MIKNGTPTLNGASQSALADEQSAIVRLNKIKKEIMNIPIAGVTPLIPNQWSEKSRRLMREAQSGTKVRGKHDAKDPAADAEASLYRLDDGHPGMPAAAFRSATITGARFYGKSVTMASLKAGLFIIGDGDKQLVPVQGDLTLREDTPRNSGGTCDLRYRYNIWPWSAILTVEFTPVLIDRDSVVALIDAGGNGGVGDWRPSAPKSFTGTFGRYEVSL
jgi:hypothetical protein